MEGEATRRSPLSRLGAIVRVDVRTGAEGEGVCCDGAGIDDEGCVEGISEVGALFECAGAEEIGEGNACVRPLRGGSTRSRSCSSSRVIRCSSPSSR